MTDNLVEQLRQELHDWEIELAIEQRKEAADRIEQLETALREKNAFLYKLILVNKGEIPKDEIYGVPVMCDGERIFPQLADDVVLYAARVTLRETG